MILRFSSLPVEGSNWSGPLRSDARFDSAVHRSMGDLFVSPVATMGLKISRLFPISILYFESSKVHLKMGEFGQVN